MAGIEGGNADAAIAKREQIRWTMRLHPEETRNPAIKALEEGPKRLKATVVGGLISDLIELSRLPVPSIRCLLPIEFRAEILGLIVRTDEGHGRSRRDPVDVVITRHYHHFRTVSAHQEIRQLNDKRLRCSVLVCQFRSSISRSKAHALNDIAAYDDRVRSLNWGILTDVAVPVTHQRRDELVVGDVVPGRAMEVGYVKY